MDEYLQALTTDLTDLKKCILENITESEQPNKLPRYTIKKSFFEIRSKKLDEYLKNLNFQDSKIMNFQNFQEFRLMKMFSYLKESNEKFIFHQNNQENLNENGTSQLCIVYDIIKNSKELISLIYILEWLQSFYFKDNPRREIEKKFNFSGLQNNNIKDFNPDVFNEPALRSNFNCIPYDNDIKEYSRNLEKIITKIRSGNLIEAQSLAEYNNLYNISGILYGGLPVNDFLFDNLSKISKIDFDLFPLYMRNKDFEILKKKASIAKEDNKYFSSENQGTMDNILGNPNWLSWFYSLYQLSDNDIDNIQPNSDESKNLATLLQSFLSGNSKYIETHNFNVYDWLYVKFLNLFNTKLFEKYLAVEKIDLHFTDNPDLSDFIDKNKDNTVEKIILEIQSLEYYKNEIYPNDFILDLQLQFIKSHFKEDENEKILLLEIIQNEIIQIMDDRFIKNHVDYNVKCFLNFDQINTDLHEIQYNKLFNCLYLNYWKIIYLYQLGLSLNCNGFKFENQTEITFKKNIENLKLNYDNIIRLFFNKNIEIISNSFLPDLTIYLLTFSPDFMSIIGSLIHLVSVISNKEEFDMIIKEIDRHFKPFTEEINRCLANQSKIYPLIQSCQDIDNVLEVYLNNHYEILKEDQLKIDKAFLLFSQNNVEKTTHLKHIIRLAFKFLINRKFYECLKTLEDFKDKLDTEHIIDNLQIISEDYKRLKGFNVHDYSNLVMYLFENYSEEIKVKYNLRFNIPLVFCKDLIKKIDDCFFSYFKLSQSVMKNNMTENSKLNIVSVKINYLSIRKI